MWSNVTFASILNVSSLYTAVMVAARSILDKLCNIPEEKEWAMSI